MRTAIVACIVIVALSVTLVSAHEMASGPGPNDPCDSYGDCISSSISYIRSNPDGSFYPGDSFKVPVSITSGPNTTTYSLSWSYESSVFRRSGDAFAVAGNKTGTFPITVSVTFAGSAAVGNSTQPFTSTLSVSESVTVVQLFVASHFQVANVTGPHGFVLRNPDGSFYRNDSFCVQWSASFQFSSARTDILINGSGSLPAFLRQTTSNYTGITPGRQGFVCYDITLTAPYSNSTLPLNFNAINWQKVSIAHVVGKVPFAVVQYSPMFSRFTYTDYNSGLSDAYEKPFVTLVRYGGNRPGYSYAGNVNTTPFYALNSTGERALVDNYSFSTEGFSPLFNENQGAAFRLGFNDTGKVDLNITSTNKTSTFLFDWTHRVVKYYFLGRPADFRKFVPFGIEYLNVTERLYSRNFAGRSAAVINTSYAYQPVFFSGNLTFRAVDQYGRPDPGVNITLTAVNPNPLDAYLVHEVVSLFGNDSKVLRFFKADLYNASASFQTLRPRSSGDGGWEFLVNQTNLQLDGDPPSAFQVTVAGHGTAFAYSFSNSFGLYLIPSLPVQSNSSLLEWGNATAYTFGGSVQFRSMPLAFNFSMPTPFLSWSGPADWNGMFLPPVTEPGGYSMYYPFLYGENNTVIVNVAGGGASASSVAQGGSVYTTIDVGPESGGAQSFWVRDGNGTTGQLLFSSPLLVNMDPPAPPGFEGAQSFTWSPDRNGTVTIGIVNSFGVSTPVGYYEATVHSPKTSLDYSFLWVFLAACAAFIVLGRFLHRRGTSGPETKD
ncbi:MAG: hypothetical protein JRN06_00155 [Nitrososphaerota archaeon]|nr:hypothetical protein [Nitrososphaerota archaeon]MDG7023736.1 hypothetical protein [Nitrososphaerota archaeon]